MPPSVWQLYTRDQSAQQRLELYQQEDGRYYGMIRKLEDKFYDIKYHHVVQANNQVAHELSKIGSTWVDILAKVFIQDLVAPSIKQEQEAVKEKTPAEQIVATVLGPRSD